MDYRWCGNVHSNTFCYIVRQSQIGCQQASSHTEEARSYSTKGWQKYYDSDYASAMDYLNNALNLTPDDIEIIERIGYVKYALGDYQEAIYNWDKVIKANPIEKGSLVDNINQAKERLANPRIVSKEKEQLDDNSLKQSQTSGKLKKAEETPQQLLAKGYKLYTCHNCSKQLYGIPETSGNCPHCGISVSFPANETEENTKKQRGQYANQNEERSYTIQITWVV